jgi:hypothetical protein
METKVETFMGGDPGWIRTSDLQLRRLRPSISRHFIHRAKSSVVAGASRVVYGDERV